MSDPSPYIPPYAVLRKQQGEASLNQHGAPIDTRGHAGGDDLARAAWAAIARPIEELGELAA